MRNGHKLNSIRYAVSLLSVAFLIPLCLGGLNHRCVAQAADSKVVSEASHAEDSKDMLTQSNALELEHRAERTFNFAYEVRLPRRDLVNSTSLWIPLPAKDKWQKIKNEQIKSNLPYKISADAQENRILFLEAKGDQPSEITVQYSAEVTRLKRSDKDGKPLELKDKDIYLESTSLGKLTDDVVSMANQIVTASGAKTEREKAKAIYDYVLANMKYDKSGSGWGKGDLTYACSAKHGNCSDFHSLFIALCRAAYIPAQFEIGFPVSDESGNISGYHCWAEFFDSKHGWVPVDASDAWKHKELAEFYFGNLDANRIQFTRGRDLVLNPMQSSGPLNFFVFPHAEQQRQDISSSANTKVYTR